MEYLVELLTVIADTIVYAWLGLSKDALFTSALHYFLVTFLEILILLVVVTFLMGVIQHYLSFEKIRDFLEKKKKLGIANLIASSFGAITPFCSCSSTPIFIGMMQAKVPLGVSLSFLVTSPLVNELAVALFWASFGWKVTIIYVITGVMLGVFGGLILDKLGMSKYIAEWVKNLDSKKIESGMEVRTSLVLSIPFIFKQTVTTSKKLLPFVFVGIAIGSFIHGYVPEKFFEEYISEGNWYAVPLAVVLAIPLYIDAAAILPLIDTFIAKGVPMGTAIAFMMAAIGLSLPEALLLKKVMQRKLILGYFATIGIGMIMAGYLFNYIF